MATDWLLSCIFRLGRQTGTFDVSAGRLFLDCCISCGTSSRLQDARSLARTVGRNSRQDLFVRRPIGASSVSGPHLEGERESFTSIGSHGQELCAKKADKKSRPKWTMSQDEKANALLQQRLVRAAPLQATASLVLPSGGKTRRCLMLVKTIASHGGAKAQIES